MSQVQPRTIYPPTAANMTTFREWETIAHMMIRALPYPAAEDHALIRHIYFLIPALQLAVPADD